MRGKLYILLFLSVSLAWVVFATLYVEPQEQSHPAAPFLQADSSGWSAYIQTLDQRARLAQLLLLQPPATLSPDSLWAQLEGEKPPGGLAISGETSLWQWQYESQRHSPTPLLMAHLGGKHPVWDIPPHPGSLSIQDEALLQEWSRAAGQYHQTQGYHLYLVPGLTRLIRPENQIDWQRRSIHLIRGFQSAHILPVFDEAQPYFPMETDSLRREALLWPYVQLAHGQASGLMLSRESVGQIKWNSQRKNIIRSYLEGHAEYQGLLLARVQTGPSLSDQIAQIVKSGTDLIVVPQAQYAATLEELEKLLQSGEIRPSDLEDQLFRIFLARKWSGALASHQLAKATDSLSAPVVPEDPWLAHRLAQSSVTLVRNETRSLPLTDLANREIRVISIGETWKALENRLAFYAPFQSETWPKDAQGLFPPLPLSRLGKASPLLVVFPDEPLDTVQQRPFWQSLKALERKTAVWILQFGDLTALSHFETFPTLLHAYQGDSITQDLCAQVLMGGMAAQGWLPVPLGERLGYGQQNPVEPVRLGYFPPEAVAMDPRQLAGIDQIVWEAIAASATPGAQVLVAKSGKVVYHKAFGYQTYQRRRPVQLTDLYDIASVTKVAATTLAAMKMTDAHQLSPQHRLEHFFKNRLIAVNQEGEKDTVYLSRAAWDSLPKSDSNQWVVQFASQRQDDNARYDSLTIGDSLRIIRTLLKGIKRVNAPLYQVQLADLMTHFSGLPKGLPILPYLNYRKGNKAKYGRYFQAKPTEQYGIGVAADFYLRNDYRDSLLETARYLHPYHAPFYEYSDLNMILVQQAIDSLNQEPIDLFLDRTFYQPLGLHQTMYLPRDKVEYQRIVPTEYDHQWRGQLLRGYVHDPTAALLGGISGNAGLFTNANDLAILFQMLLNGGVYGGQRYLSPETIGTYTRAQRGHRGYGFDKPPRGNKSHYIIAPSASDDSYGHTGFTGTCVWVDPEQELVFVFLSNRVHPTARNWKLNEMEVRQRVHEQVYRALR